jgi:mannose-6-phosphate isomerase-like protein (cupin superfamily)
VDAWPGGTASAEVVIPCADLEATLGFFTRALGLRVEAIFPADHPRVAVVAGHGVRLRLDTSATGDPGRLRLSLADAQPRTLVAPNGTVIDIADQEAAISLPELQERLVVTRADAGSWGVGRAGMRYRDLIPDRLGGRFIASHIAIPDGGPVPDYVHFHKVRFQMIFCRRGWVRLVYEDQGEPFVLQAGDCVLQPPQIRHRVLEASPGLEVVEIACPAEHETRVDHEMHLPNGGEDAARDFGGQFFVRHDARTAQWCPRADGFHYRDTGIGGATKGLAGARVLRPAGTLSAHVGATRHEFRFMFVLEGSVRLRTGAEEWLLGEADAVTVPSGTEVMFCDPSADLELLEVTLPAEVAR